MQGFICGSTGSHAVASDHFRSALDVIEWGRKTWKDVPRADRSDIFDLLFLRAVNRLFIASVMDVSSQLVSENSMVIPDSGWKQATRNARIPSRTSPNLRGT
jgi:hypothetical protein